MDAAMELDERLSRLENLAGISQSQKTAQTASLIARFQKCQTMWNESLLGRNRPIRDLLRKSIY